MYPATTTYNTPTTVTLTANNVITPAGYTAYFSSWSGDVSGTSNPISINVNGIKNVVANYKSESSMPTQVPGIYSLTVNTGDGYNPYVSVYITPPGKEYNYPVTITYPTETAVTLSAAGYYTVGAPPLVFSYWSGDVSGTASTITIDVNGVKTVTANYSINDVITPSPTAAPCMYNKLGDINGNGIIDIVDALFVAQFYVGLNPFPFGLCAGDVNRDGKVDIVDALRIAQCYVGLIPCSF